MKPEPNKKSKSKYGSGVGPYLPGFSLSTTKNTYTRGSNMDRVQVIVPVSWFERLATIAKDCEENPDDTIKIAILIGYATSAETIIKYHKRHEEN